MQISHNPALGPHAPWDLDKVSINDAAALIEKLPPPGRELIACLARRPDAWTGIADVARELSPEGVTDAFLESVRAAVRLTPGARTLCRTV